VADRQGRAFDLAAGRRIDAVTALGTIRTREAEDGVLLGLEDSDPRVRHAAVEALRPVASARALKALAHAAAVWRDPALKDAREAAVGFLVELGDELYAVEYTQVLVEDDERSSLSAAEETAVRELFSADSGPVAEIFANQLALRLSGADEPERRIVLQTLVAMGEVSVGPLTSTLSDPSGRHLAARALGALRDTSAVGPLVSLLASSDSVTRAAAARALGDIRDPSALEALMRASGDPNADVRDAAMDALDDMRGIVLAMFGNAPLVGDGMRGLPPPGGVPSASPPPPSRTVIDHRSLLERLRGRKS
jgi:HEAT repeat protein